MGNVQSSASWGLERRLAAVDSAGGHHGRARRVRLKVFLVCNPNDCGGGNQMRAKEGIRRGRRSWKERFSRFEDVVEGGRWRESESVVLMEQFGLDLRCVGEHLGALTQRRKGLVGCSPATALALHVIKSATPPEISAPPRIAFDLHCFPSYVRLCCAAIAAIRTHHQ